MSNPIPVGRRAFLTGGSLVLTAGIGTALGGRSPGGDKPARGGAKFGLVTDLHYADKPAAGSRCYRETLGKLAEAAERFGKEKPAFVVELGDLVDAADAVETELAYLKRVDTAFAAVSKDRHYVLGNHCVDTLTKDEFLGGSGGRSLTTRSTPAGSTSSSSTPVSGPTASRTGGRTSRGPTPTSRRPTSTGSRRI